MLLLLSTNIISQEKKKKASSPKDAKKVIKKTTEKGGKVTKASINQRIKKKKKTYNNWNPFNYPVTSGYSRHTLKLYLGIEYQNPLEYSINANLSLARIANIFVQYGFEYALTNHIGFIVQSAYGLRYGFPDQGSVQRRMIPLLFGARYNLIPRIPINPFIGFLGGGYFIQANNEQRFTPAFVANAGISSYIIGLLFMELDISYAVYHYYNTQIKDNYNSISVSLKTGIYL